ncbi:MAG: Metal dependent phosphohydrolase [Candidatus Falkowbacteria bacterium GW2011_GWC2_38_22]|uniref:Metal dependent phosphohydrolase n=1 Tax=Candidatus Falkowbacteria bacterium GW2011_GWE1_38_31 TaxID=1618638 RepID=A0A0G0JQI2_9BACT|nr:MAG: Metal dependent phosphohydrolase [Candidatus Falkowbacteria bacterium GW2011_GWF2_38_1205]KKQ60918.1 MAG: Metal dependent phosphohydrolase [Candidatus Falkowbacteria bacterium GW2011_GWC2_38_22]KKQ63036.1 MAG: Metal dependent phosphohydrolase [Candidatus Falkowbacteria bacterium GW2011_GWF1_38_22]KKQ65058.1 MAG: Metal dependent phosphohydrolase [Candidatus Falkowbacteria bacterium GW2011_GWE2_38_254]KKQ69833.1 MAG: Metal dependent phosphohydrolase [Candidatus Falkowbacteria bacterium GW
MPIKKIVNFIFELSQLKRQVHAGWLKIGIKQPVSVAEHVFRAAQIGYILAEMEGDTDPEKVVTILIIHDNAETRIGDQDKVAARYYSNKEAEIKAFTEQTELLSDKIQKKWKAYFNEYENRTTKEGIIAKDADWLEQAFQAKEYVDCGYKAAQNWIDNVAKAVETESAKKIIAEMQKTEFTEWFDGLKKMTHKKL